MSTGPGKSYRKGLTLVQLFEKFPDDDAAEKWFVEQRWPDGVCCTECGSMNVQVRRTRKPQPYRCRDCRKDFSVKTDSLMHGSNMGYQKWAMAVYLVTTGLKGISSLKLGRDLGITQKSAWHMAHRIRESWQDDIAESYSGPVEMDETYVGGKERNKHLRKKLGRDWQQGRMVILGMKDRDTNHVSCKNVKTVSNITLSRFVAEHLASDVMVYSDEHPGYRMLPNPNLSVNHHAGQYVDGDISTNAIESFWALLKRGHYGIYHSWSHKHCHRYLVEFSGRFNHRELDTEGQMTAIVQGMNGKRLRYRDLVR